MKISKAVFKNYNLVINEPNSVEIKVFQRSLAILVAPAGNLMFI